MHDMNQKKAGVIITYFTMGIRVLIGFIYTPFMLLKVGDSQYGIYSLSLSLISFITLLDLGFSQTSVRYIAKARVLENKEEEEKLNGFFLQLYSVIAVLALVIGIAIIFIYPVICKTTMTIQEAKLFRIVFSVLLVDTVVSFPMCIFSATINAYERFYFQKMLDLVLLIVKYVAMTLLLLIGYKVIAVIIAATATSILLKILNGLYCKKKLDISFRFGGYAKNMVKEISWFSFFIFLNLIIDFLYNNTDKLILGAVNGTAAVTVYSFGVYFQSHFQELSTAMSSVFMPKIVYLFEHNRDMKGISDLFLRVGRLQMVILALTLSGFVAYGKEFIHLWLGMKYSDAYYIGILIMLPAFVPLTQNIGISVLRAMNLHKHRSYMYLAIAVFNVGISIPLAKRYAGIGAAVGTCVACIAGQIIFMNLYYAKKIGIDIIGYWRNVVHFLIMTIPIVVSAVFIKHIFPIKSLWSLLAHIVVYAVVYSVIYWLFVSNIYEKQMIKSLINKAIGGIK